MSQVRNQKLLIESGIGIPFQVDNWIIELEDGAKMVIPVACNRELIGVL